MSNTANENDIPGGAHGEPVVRQAHHERGRVSYAILLSFGALFTLLGSLVWM